MKKASEIWEKELKEMKADDYFAVSNYNAMLDEFGEILLQVDNKDWSGDSRVLYTDGDKVGYLQFGWGSCSGCDALQGCQNIEEVQGLMDNLCSSIKWFDNAQDALQFFMTHDWEGDYGWHEEKQKEFIKQSIEILKLAIK